VIIDGLVIAQASQMAARGMKFIFIRDGSLTLDELVLADGGSHGEALLRSFKDTCLSV
jgi:hypothetical protein